MIDNIIMLLSGTIHGRSPDDVLERCHPLGYFDTLATVAVAQSTQELYELVLFDSPLAVYFEKMSLSEEDLTEVNIEILRNGLYCTYLNEFHKWCKAVGGATEAIMGSFLSFEADRRAMNITINSLGPRSPARTSSGSSASSGCCTRTATGSWRPARSSRT